MNAQCPNDGELLLLLDGLLPEARRDEIEAHLDTCADCRRVLGAIAAPLDRAPKLEGAMAAKVEEFELVRRLGRGGMGEVWLARDTLLERDVALKLGRGAMTDEARSRFLVEARAVARLRHPNILAVHHVGEIEGQPFLVTELLRGRSLEGPRPDPPERGRRHRPDLSRALAAAHAAGVLHRDVKPANAFLCDDGTAKLLDFGLAKLTQDPATAAPEDTPGMDLRPGTVSSFDVTSPAPTGSGALMGTPLYMAPETWRAQAATRATDVYLLGGLLFTLLAGRAPHAGLPSGRCARQCSPATSPTWPSSRRTPPAPLVALVRRCLSLDPDDRPSAEAVCQALQALAAPGAAPEAGDEDKAGNPYRGLLSFGAEHRRLSSAARPRRPPC